MPPKSTKKSGPSLFKTFVDAYRSARPNEKRDVSLYFNQELKILVDLGKISQCTH
jgi:hypothetical protein